MPEGVKGFQPGRAKTGGRTKKDEEAPVIRKSNKFVEQLKDAGFNYVKELAGTLKDMKELRNLFSGDPKKLTEEMKKAEEIRHYYIELKSLLPYMAPKLREKEVDTTEPADPVTPEAAISTEDLLKALNGKEVEDHPRASDPNPVGAGSPELQIPASTAEDPSNLAGEQEEI